MTTATPSSGPGAPTKLSKVSAWFALTIATLIALQGLFLLFLGFDEANFAEAAGIEWTEFEADNPEVAAYLDQGSADRVFAVTSLGLGLQTALLIFLSMRGRQMVSKPILFILPAVLIGWSLILMPANQSAIAIPSLAIGILMAIALAVSGRALNTLAT